MKGIRSLGSRLAANDFIRGVMILVSGTAVSQAAVVLLTPLLTRLYTPEDFGVLSVYLSCMFTIAIISSWSYEVAIPLPKEEQDAVHLLVLSFLLLVFNALVAAILLKILKGPILSVFDMEGLQEILVFLPFSIFGFGVFQLFQMWMLRKENYRQITTGKVRMNVSQIFSQAGLGLLVPSAGSLMAGEVIGRLAGGGGMAYVSWKEFKHKLALISVKSTGRIALRYRRFPLVSSWSSLLSGLTKYMPAMFIALTMGAKPAGWYLLADRVLALPDALLGYSVKQVYIAKSAKILHTSFAQFTALFWKTTKKMGVISFAVYAAIALIAPFVFPPVFGADWGKASIFVQCLSVLYVCQLIVGPISATFDLLEEQYIEVLSQLVRLVVLLIGMGVAYLFLEKSWEIVLCLSFAGATGFFMMGMFAWTAVVQKQKKMDRTRGESYGNCGKSS